MNRQLLTGAACRALRALALRQSEHSPCRPLSGGPKPSARSPLRSFRTRSGSASSLANAVLVLCLTTLPPVFGQQTGAPAPGTAAVERPADLARIISAFTAKETEFHHALDEYAFKRDVVIQVIGMGGQIGGEYRRISTLTFDNQGRRYEKIISFPIPTFAGVTPEDLEDLGGVDPFALEASKLNQYEFTYAGKERIDELDLYMFDVAPKRVPDPSQSHERYFKGRIWVDDHDLQIVKSRGKGIPETSRNKFPVVETYREQIDGRYWFPTYTYADDRLVFGNGSVMHIRMRVRYSNFERARGKVIIKDAEEPSPTPSPSRPKP